MADSQQLVSKINPYLKKSLTNNHLLAYKGALDDKSFSTLKNSVHEKNVSGVVNGTTPISKKESREQLAIVKKEEKCSSKKKPSRSSSKINRTKLKREIEVLKEMKRQKLITLKANNVRQDSSKKLDCEPTAADVAAVADTHDRSTIKLVAKEPNCITPTNTRYPVQCISHQTTTPLNTSQEMPVVVPSSNKYIDGEKNTNFGDEGRKVISTNSSLKASISSSKKENEFKANYINNMTDSMLEHSPEQDTSEKHPCKESVCNINQVTTTSNSNPPNNFPEVSLLSTVQQSSLARLHQPMIQNYCNYNSSVPPYTNNSPFYNSINTPSWAYTYYYYHHQQCNNFTYYPVASLDAPFEQHRQQQLSALSHDVSAVENKDLSPALPASTSESSSSSKKEMPSVQNPNVFCPNNSSSDRVISSFDPTYPFPVRVTSYEFPPCFPNCNYFSPHFHYSGWGKTNLIPQTRLTRKPSSKVLILSAAPVDSPSPWSKTHTIIPKLITVSKSNNFSYGFEVKFVTKYNYEVKCSTTTDACTPEAPVSRSSEESSSQYTSKTNSIPMKTLEEKPQEQIKSKASRKRRTYGAVMVTNPGRQSHTLQEGDIILSIEGVPVGLAAKTEFFSQALTLMKNGDNGFEEVCCGLEIARRVSGLVKKFDRKERVPVPTTTADENKQQVESAVELKPFIIDSNTHEVISGEFSEGEMKILVLKIQQHLGEASERDDSIFLWEKVALSIPHRDASSVHKKWLLAIHECETEMKMKATSFWEKTWALEEEKASTGNPAKVGETESKYRFLSDAARAQLRAHPRPAFGCRCGSMNHQRVDDDSCILYRNNRLLLPMNSEISSSDQAISRELKLHEKKKKTIKSVVVAAGLDRIRRLKSELAADRKEAQFINEMELRQVQNGFAVFAPSLSMMVISAVAAILSIKQPHFCDGVEEDELPLTEVATRLKDPSVSLVEIAVFISKTWGSVYVEPSYVQSAWRCKVYELITGKAYPRDGFVAASFAMPQNIRQQGGHSFENLRFLLDNEEKMQRLKRFQWVESPISHQDPFLADLKSQSAAESLMFTYLVSSVKTGLLDEICSLQEAGVLERLGVGIRLKKNWVASVDPMLLAEMHETWSNDEGNRHCIHGSIRQQLLSSWQRTDDGWVFDSQLQYSHKDFEAKHNDFVNEFEEWQDEVQGVGKYGL